MARMKSITTIENEIAKTESELTKLQKKQDALADKLLTLQKEKQDYEARQIIDAYRRSGKTLHEMMIFLGA
jgi:septal ring factor EnvC (AmiA/AmiB activator)